MRRVRRTSPEVRLELTPLIDVVFLLLTFFVFSMVLMVRADVLDVELPALTAGQPAQRVEAITVAVDAAGRVFVEGEAVELSGLAAELRRRLEEPGAGERPILIAVDEGGRAGRLIEVADAMSAAGITRFSVIGRVIDRVEERIEVAPLGPPGAGVGGGA